MCQYQGEDLDMRWSSTMGCICDGYDWVNVSFVMIFSHISLRYQHTYSLDSYPNEAAILFLHQ